MSNTLTTMAQGLASQLGVETDPGELVGILKATAFRTKQGDPQPTDAQLVALLIIAKQYQLNPWTKEIYAFPDKNNGIVPVVGVDGWARIINNHPQFDGVEFDQDKESCTCMIYRKDRSKPIAITEYLAECKRNTPPWSSHPRRLLRHKALIQCARIAFGYVGIFDEDEAQRIAGAEKDITPQAQRLSGEHISEEQHTRLLQAMQVAGVDQAAFCRATRINDVRELAAHRFTGAMDYLQEIATNAETPNQTTEGAQ